MTHPFSEFSNSLVEVYLLWCRPSQITYDLLVRQVSIELVFCSRFLNLLIHLGEMSSIGL